MQGNIPELRLQNKKSPYQYQPIIRQNVKDRLPQKRKEAGERAATQPNDAPEQATAKEPLKRQGRTQPEATKMPPIMPPPDQQTRKMTTSSRNDQRSGNCTHKK